MSPISLRRSFFPLLGLSLALSLCAGTAQAGSSLTLRVNDAEAVPGGTVAVVVRTYAPEPVGQGQLCFRTCFAGIRGSCFAGIGGYLVFSTQGDAQSWLEPQPVAGGDQVVVLDFFSPSGSINEADGPMAVLLLQLSDAIPAGRSFVVEVDAANSFLFDEAGNPIPIDTRPGLISVRDPAAPRKLLVEGDRIAPGQVADLGVDTVELFGVRRGRLAFHYSRRIAAGAPVVSFDPRHGQVSFTVDNSTPGLTIIDFQSPDGSLNQLPGRFVRIALPTRADVVPGTRSRVELVSTESYLETPDGDRPVIKLYDDFVEFE